MNTPRSVDISITSKCNLRCKYCGHFASASEVDNDLPLKEWLSFFKELRDCAVISVVLEGGEPFYRKDIKEIICGIVENKMRYSILSNGTLLTEEMAKFISQTKRCNFIQISLDGASPDPHEQMRGKGTFLKALRAIGLLKEYRIPVTVRVTVHKKNIHDLENIARLILVDLGLPRFGINSADYRGLCQLNAPEVRLNIQERSLAMAVLFKLDILYPNRIKATAGPLSAVRAWLAMRKAFLEKKEGRGGYLSACRAPRDKLSVRADGMLVPCGLLSEIELGRINEVSLKKVWQGHPELKKLRQRASIPLSSFTYCKDCVYLKYCTGGCPAITFAFLEDYNQPLPEGCLRHFLEEGGRLPDELSFA